MVSHIPLAQQYIEKEYDKGQVEWVQACTEAIID